MVLLYDGADGGGTLEPAATEVYAYTGGGYWGGIGDILDVFDDDIFGGDLYFCYDFWWVGFLAMLGGERIDLAMDVFAVCEVVYFCFS